MKTCKRSIFIMVLVTVFSLAGIGSSVFAVDNKYTRETLKGFNGVYVLVEDLDHEVEQAGLSKSQIQTDVELKFRLAGIKVLTEEEGYKEKGMPYIYIAVNSFQQKPFDSFIYNLSCEFVQRVFLERNPNLSTQSPTWSTGWLAQGHIKDIREKIKDRADEFINAYFTVNPKK